MIEVLVSNTIIITGLLPVESQKIKDVLTLENPQYQMLIRMGGRAAYASTPLFFFYKEKGGVLIIPRGMRERLMNFLNKLKKPVRIIEDFISKPL